MAPLLGDTDLEYFAAVPGAYASLAGRRIAVLGPAAPGLFLAARQAAMLRMEAVVACLSGEPGEEAPRLLGPLHVGEPLEALRAYLSSSLPAGLTPPRVVGATGERELLEVCEGAAVCLELAPVPGRAARLRRLNPDALLVLASAGPGGVDVVRLAAGHAVPDDFLHVPGNPFAGPLSLLASGLALGEALHRLASGDPAPDGGPGRLRYPLPTLDASAREWQRTRRIRNILVVGSGGLGCHLALALLALKELLEPGAWLHLTFVDREGAEGCFQDRNALSTPQWTPGRSGRPKPLVLTDEVNRRGGGRITACAVQRDLDSEQVALELLQYEPDLILRATDNLESTHYVHRALCVGRGIPMVHAATSQPIGCAIRAAVPGLTPCLDCSPLQLAKMVEEPASATAGPGCSDARANSMIPVLVAANLAVLLVSDWLAARPGPVRVPPGSVSYSLVSGAGRLVHASLTRAEVACKCWGNGSG